MYLIRGPKGEEKERIQIFQGDVIAMRKQGASTTFTVRKIGAHSVAVERKFPLYSPIIKTIKVIKVGDVRRAKLYYVRDRIGKSARLKEKVLTREQKEQQAARHATDEKVTPGSVTSEGDTPVEKSPVDQEK